MYRRNRNCHEGQDLAGTSGEDMIRARTSGPRLICRILFKAFGGNPTYEEIEEQLKTIDLDGDGTVDYPEFLS